MKKPGSVGAATRQRLITRSYFVGSPAPEQSLLAPFVLVFGGRLRGPRARRSDRGSSFARVRKQS
jgi:hypothetical protein